MSHLSGKSILNREKVKKVCISVQEQSYQTEKSSEKYDDEKAKSILNSEESEKSMSHLGGISILNREKSEKV